MFAILGFSNLVRLEDYVKDMQAISHDYVLMGLELKTDEEYAGMGLRRQVSIVGPRRPTLSFAGRFFPYRSDR